jgi:hypothetical protein
VRLPDVRLIYKRRVLSEVLKKMAATPSKSWPKALVEEELKRRKKKTARSREPQRIQKKTRVEIPWWDDAVGPDAWRSHGG